MQQAGAGGIAGKAAPCVSRESRAQRQQGDGLLRFPGREKTCGRMFLEKTNSTSIRPNGSLAKSARAERHWATRETGAGGRVGRVGCGLTLSWEGVLQVPRSGLFTEASSGERGLQASPSPAAAAKPPLELRGEWPVGTLGESRLLQTALTEREGKSLLVPGGAVVGNKPRMPASGEGLPWPWAAHPGHGQV